MRESIPSPCGISRPGELRGSARAQRRLLIASLAALLGAIALLMAPALASADSASQLTVVGTSDVNDSGLIPNVIMPQFEKAYPQYTFKYEPSATGLAIQEAENGTGGPSALIVHAPSLENQFVAGGFSYNNQYGNAIFTNDFVLAGPTSDPAGVGTNAAHNIAQAFADIATSGSAGKATFYTRGGTNTASGTTVEEHEIWSLVHTSGLQPASLSLCVVSTADGGGMSPVASSGLNNQPCPDSGTVNSADAPSWYFVNAGANQGANVVAANACTGHPANSCYVLTDRGTFDYLASGTDPAGSIPNLKIVTRDDSASAPGGANELINYFHVYIINPTKPGETVNLTAAKDFVGFLTSTTFQSELRTYLDHTSDPGGAPFVADASPILTASALPKSYHAGKQVKVTGTLTNAEPGYPVLAGKTVEISEIEAGLPIEIASGKTNSVGHYSISFVPPTNGSYEVSTPQISQIEIPTLSPPYGDLLSPAATTPVKISVHSATSNFSVKSQGGKALVTGTVKPGTGHVKATVTVLAHAVGAKGGFKKVASDRLSATQGNYAIVVPRAPGTWQFKVSYKDPNQVYGATTRTVKVTIGAAPATHVTAPSLTQQKGHLTIGGAVGPAAVGGAKVELLGLNTTPGAPVGFKVLGTVKLKAGATKYTLHATVKRGVRWALQLEYVQPGQAPSFSGLRTVAVR